MAGPGIDVPGPALLLDHGLLERTLAELSTAEVEAFWAASGRTVAAFGAAGSGRRPARWAAEVVALRGVLLDTLERRRPRHRHPWRRGALA